MKKSRSVDASRWMKSLKRDRRAEAERRIYGTENAPPRKKIVVDYKEFVRPTLETRARLRKSKELMGLSNHKLALLVGDGCQTQHVLHATTRKPQRGVPQRYLEVMAKLLSVKLELEDD